MSPAITRRLSLPLTAGAVLWMATERIEIAGVLSQATMAMTSLAFLGMMAGVWAVHGGQADKGNKMSLIGAACLFTTYLIFTSGSLSVLGSMVTYEQLAEANWIFAGFFFMLCGAPLLGIPIIRARIYPQWTGATLIASAFCTTTSFLAHLPTVLMNIANLAIGLSYFVIAQKIRSAPR